MVTKVEIFYDAKCKHCKNYKSNGRGKKSECMMGKVMWLGGNTLACDEFKLN